MEFFGHKTTAIFDLWSIVHFLTGCGLAYPMMLLSRKLRLKQADKVWIVLLISALWELAEIYLELGDLAGEQVRYWLQGVEHPLNRIVADQFLLLLGYLFAQDRKKISILAKAIAVAWLLWHILVLPHSMYIQDSWNLILNT